jgi:hypothetical protein
MKGSLLEVVTIPTATDGLRLPVAFKVGSGRQPTLMA